MQCQTPHETQGVKTQLAFLSFFFFNRSTHAHTAALTEAGRVTHPTRAPEEAKNIVNLFFFHFSQGCSKIVCTSAYICVTYIYVSVLLFLFFSFLQAWEVEYLVIMRHLQRLLETLRKSWVCTRNTMYSFVYDTTDTHVYSIHVFCCFFCFFSCWSVVVQYEYKHIQLSSYVNLASSRTGGKCAIKREEKQTAGREGLAFGKEVTHIRCARLT